VKRWKTELNPSFLIMLFDQLPPEWGAQLDLPDGLLKEIDAAVEKERNAGDVYPPCGHELEALKAVQPDAVKVIICGQDPYHGPGQAHGLAFSVAPGIPHPPSLRNILKEAATDLSQPWPLERSFDGSGCLGSWARAGVLLLNDVLTVQAGKPGSHSHLRWQEFTGAVLDLMADQKQPLVVLLWGKPAQAHANRFANPNHLVLQSPHPSPLSAFRGFIGSRPFSKANAWLEEHGVDPVDWMGQ
jgi:uracil-DNA glycosylase